MSFRTRNNPDGKKTVRKRHEKSSQSETKTVRKRQETIKQPESQIRVSSITRKMHFYWLRKEIASMLLADLFFFCGLAVVWLAGLEFGALETLSFAAKRSLRMEGGLTGLVYLVSDREGTVMLERSLWPAAGIFLGGLAAVLAFQTVYRIVCLSEEYNQIRRILTPINEIALKADELSRLSFSEEKYHVIENAIANVTPGEETMLNFGDSDLSGIEAAMNNLLLRMRDTYRQQARFVNDASHELRTPIAVIKGYANMLDRWGKTDSKILEEGITAIKNETAGMEHLVEQLLFLARGDSGSTKLTMTEVSPGQLMREIYEESLLIDEHHIYRLAGSGEETVIQADAGLLKQAVRILVDNAAKYTPEGSEIFLESGRISGTEVYLQVQDTGIGMREEDVQGMFERFYRSDEVRSYPGTGLGLSISKWIVDRHHGHFEVLSRTDLGTRIRVVLPVSEKGRKEDSDGLLST